MTKNEKLWLWFTADLDEIIDMTDDTDGENKERNETYEGSTL